MGRRDTSIPVGRDAEDESAYEKEMERLKQDVGRTHPSYNELLQLRKACAPHLAERGHGNSIIWHAHIIAGKLRSFLKHKRGVKVDEDERIHFTGRLCFKNPGDDNGRPKPGLVVVPPGLIRN